TAPGGPCAGRRPPGNVSRSRPWVACPTPRAACRRPRTQSGRRTIAAPGRSNRTPAARPGAAGGPCRRHPLSPWGRGDTAGRADSRGPAGGAPAPGSRIEEVAGWLRCRSCLGPRCSLLRGLLLDGQLLEGGGGADEAVPVLLDVVGRPALLGDG